jgi:type IV pilus assembly protein PilV
MLSTQRHQQGVSLIESMISLLVISVGLLGIAALQVTSISQNASALNHSQAVWIANNMADRVRANGGAFDSYKGITTGQAGNDNCNSVCTPEAMVKADTADFSNMVKSLPSAKGEIEAIAGSPNGVAITVMWDDEGTNPAGDDCNGDPQTNLTCYIAVVSVSPVVVAIP